MERGQIPGGRAFKMKPGVRILASAMAFPEPIALPSGQTPEWISNEDIFHMVMGPNYEAIMESQGFRADYPEQVIGLKHRRWSHLIGAPSNHQEENCVDLGVKAVRNLFSQLEIGPDAIDLVLFASTTPHKITTSSSCAMAAELGIQAPCYDMKSGCSTGVYSLLQACMYIHAGFDRVLLVVSETPSKYANPQVRETVIGVGDGAVALLLMPGPDSEGVKGAFMGADGELGKLVNTPGLLPPTHEAIDAQLYSYHGNAGELKEAVPMRYLDAMQGALKQAEMTVSDIDWYIPHQVNRALTTAVAEKLEIPLERQIYTLHKYGSMTGAAVLSALHEGLHNNKIRAGDTVALNTVGGGLTWSGVIWQF